MIWGKEQRKTGRKLWSQVEVERRGVERYSGRQLESEQHEQKSPCNFQYDPANKMSPETHDERECKSEWTF